MKLKVFIHCVVLVLWAVFTILLSNTPVCYAKSDPTTTLSPGEEKNIESILNQGADMESDTISTPGLNSEEGEYPLPDENDPDIEDPSDLEEDYNPDIEPNPESGDNYEDDTYPVTPPDDEEDLEYDENYEDPIEEPMDSEDGEL